MSIALGARSSLAVRSLRGCQGDSTSDESTCRPPGTLFVTLCLGCNTVQDSNCEIQTSECGRIIHQPRDLPQSASSTKTVSAGVGTIDPAPRRALRRIRPP